MNIVYIHSSYSPNDLIGNWFNITHKWTSENGGNTFFAIKFTHKKVSPNNIQIGSRISCYLHASLFNHLGLQDCFSYFATRKFLRKLNQINPDIIHCHVINDCFLHLGLFCNYVNKHNIKVVWTFHDARALTGMCPCPNYCECDQWKTICKNCHPRYKFLYPAKPIVNLVNIVHNYRKRTIGNIQNLTIVTPSKWMASMVAQSYLKNKKCTVINNGINLKIFHPTVNQIRDKYNIPHQVKLLLSIGNPIWRLKGREFIHKLINELPKEYFIIMIGCLEQDVKQFKGHKNVLALPQISRDELIQFYSAADLFINPTLADNFPTVNLESQACGTPVVAFDTDGTRETVDPQKGIIVERGNYKALKDAILHFKFEGAKETAIDFSKQFDQEECIRKYINLYKTL